jgi:pimeloyl-ACP methyl ester carboxylesterase
VLPAFTDSRRCILPDLLQYGRSDKPVIEGPVWDYHAAKLLALFDELDVDRADVICNSWGGTAAIRLASLHPDRIRSLVITGSMPVFYGPLAPLPERAARGRNARDRYYGGEGPTWDKMRDLIARLEWYDESLLPDETVTMRFEQSLDPGERALGESGVGRGDLQDLTADVMGLAVPVLFCWGMYDAFLTPDYPLMLARMAPFGSLHVMDRVSHHLQEERPQQFAAVVTGFLDSVRGR